jgi:pimeloyl-ACP methyl ester carboxylesterase
LKKRYSSLALGTLVLHYSCLVGGSKILLTFHGFGQSKQDFEALEKTLALEYTIYSFDLFYHGEHPEDGPDRPLTKADWKEWMRAFFTAENIHQYSVLGFSLGGRFALATIEAFPDRATALLLIAPDGIKPNFWYSLATRSKLSQTLFRRVVYDRQSFQALATLVRTLRLAHPKLIRFAQSQLDSPEKQRQLYRSWINFRPLSFHIPTIAALLNEKRIRTEIFLGKHDLLLKEKDVEALTRRLKNYRLILLESGHTHLLDRASEYFLWQTPSEKRTNSV